MHEARLRADDFRQMRQEGDNVVLDLGLDGIDPRHVEGRGPALVPDFLSGFLRDLAELGHGVGGMRLDLEPDAEARLGRPDRSHFGAAVARNHPTKSFFFLPPPERGRSTRHRVRATRGPMTSSAWRVGASQSRRRLTPPRPPSLRFGGRPSPCRGGKEKSGRHRDAPWRNMPRRVRKPRQGLLRRLVTGFALPRALSSSFATSYAFPTSRKASLPA